MNKEVHYEGWLIKSPPTKRIWRARWRRRWFTLKQGEIPEQFCLEYYTDRNCRKLKGVIDLDQCEQVDCGLRLENRKQKFQFMFDIKTPKRTYYLAADTEADMRDWVNCICQVCHLHDTKQPNNELLTVDENSISRIVPTVAGGTVVPLVASYSINNSTSTSFNSSKATTSAEARHSYNQEQTFSHADNSVMVVSEQPIACNHSEGSYVNTEYTNRETLVSSAIFSSQQAQHLQQQITNQASNVGAAIYLNSPVVSQIQPPLTHQSVARLAVNTNGVVRKLPENLVLNNTALPDADTQQHSVQPSPALSTASGPYIPISECFSGSPKFAIEGNNPTTPLNNLDPKFYDTPRSHNNIGLNLTNDQSYSPKITNCGTLQTTSAVKNRSQRSDSDSESVFTDDDEWTHPLPLRENTDRHTRPSDSSVENESFVLTYSQRFSKLPDETNSLSVMKHERNNTTMPEECDVSAAVTTVVTSTTETTAVTEEASADAVIDSKALENVFRVFKNKNNLVLDFKHEQDKSRRELPQFSDTENTSPAIGPRDVNSVVEESYDIPRSHNLPYYNMSQLLEKVVSPEANEPIAASTPNLLAIGLDSSVNGVSISATPNTLTRPHFYTNAAPRKVEGNVFRYDFMEQCELPPVNRKLKPKMNAIEDKPPEEMPLSLKQVVASDANTNDVLSSKLLATHLQPNDSGSAESFNAKPLKPPSVDRKSKPSAYKVGNSATLATSSRRSTCAPLSMILPHDNEGATFYMETRTLPRQPRPNYALGENPASVLNLAGHHQRTVSAAAVTPLPPSNHKHAELTKLAAAAAATNAVLVTGTGEHILQYFDLDVANAPTISRQSMSVGNLYATGIPANRTQPVKTGSVVYNSVDFVKTEAFKRIREERKKKSEELAGANNNSPLPYQLK